MAKDAASLNLIEDGRSAAAVLNPLRLQILEGLSEPDSASGLARRFGIPRQKINYHLRELRNMDCLSQLKSVVKATAPNGLCELRHAHI